MGCVVVQQCCLSIEWLHVRLPCWNTILRYKSARLIVALIRCKGAIEIDTGLKSREVTTGYGRGVVIIVNGLKRFSDYG